ncbi:argininosuccinate lyase [Diaporthe australafricana]|uniref:Arginosuccinase n=1 Tax=Diaporthe australafricana TaxID=127596 RepID=A0ABR3W8X1_9PEZI
MLPGGLDPLMEQYNESLSFDNVLHKQDILGSIAFARATTKAGRLVQDEFEKIEAGPLEAPTKDIHTANERCLGEIIGKEIGGKLHTGCSRNEQIATDMRLWLRDKLDKLEAHLKSFLPIIAKRAEFEIDYVMPGYTHLQRAQPIRWSHWMLSYGFAFANDLERLREIRKRVNGSPLGCGALVGNPFGIDREMMAKELGFEELLWNSMGAVADRDFVLVTLQWGSFLMQHIGRWAEDLIIYSSAEFGFVRLADAYSTVLRGKSGRAFGHMAGFMMTLKGLPSTYNKDLQESVEPLLDHVKTVGNSIRIAEDARFENDISESYDYEKSVEMRAAKGGTSKACVLEQVKVLTNMIAQ